MEEKKEEYNCLVIDCENKTDNKRYKFCDEHFDHCMSVGKQHCKFGRYKDLRLSYEKCITPRSEAYWLFCLQHAKMLQPNSKYTVNAIRRAFVFNEILFHGGN